MGIPIFAEGSNPSPALILIKEVIKMESDCKRNGIDLGKFRNELLSLNRALNSCDETVSSLDKRLDFYMSPSFPLPNTVRNVEEDNGDIKESMATKTVTDLIIKVTYLHKRINSIIDRLDI